MRLKASFTLENAVLIPFFTIIMVALVLFTFYLHDQIIMKNALFQAHVLIESDDMINDVTLNNELTEKVENYVQGKAFITSDIQITARVEGNNYTLIGEGVSARLPIIGTKETINREVEIGKARYVWIIRFTRLAQKTTNILSRNAMENRNYQQI